MARGRVIGIDFGAKRTGLATTDPERLIATPLVTVDTRDIFSFLSTYLKKEPVICFAIGMPKTLSGTATDITHAVLDFAQTLCTKFKKPIHWVDERFTSKEAQRTLFQAGVPKKKRQQKALIDRTAAVLILQSYLLSQR